MILFTLWIFTAIQVIVRGQTITPVYVQINAPVTLTCPADDQATTLTWTGPGGTLYVTGTTVEAGLDGTTVKRRISASRTGGSYTLTFTEFRSQDTGIYTCTVDGTEDLQMVIVQGVTSGSPVYIRQGGNVTLQCPDTGGRATWSVTSNLYIYTIGTLINPAIPASLRTRLSVIIQNGTYNLQISDVQLSDVREYRCTIGFTVTFYHLLLNSTYRPYLTLTPTPGLKVTEGGYLEIRCDVDSNPPSSITWSRVGSQLPSNAYVTSGVLRIPSAHRTDKGTYQCTAQNSAGTGQDSLVIDVQYPPDIFVSYTNNTYTSPDRVLTCVPDGNPDTYQFIEWRHTSDDGTEIRQLTGSSDLTQSVLTLPDPGVTRRYEDTGYYECTATNNIPVSSSYRSGSVFFVVEAPPVVITNTPVVKGQIGTNVTLEVEFYSRPSVSSSDVTWTRGSAGLPPPDKSVTYVDGRSILMSFHGVNVHVNGYVAVIEIQQIVEQDFGDYTVTIENKLGTIHYLLVFQSASPPSLPTNVELAHDSRSIIVQWTPGFNGGAEQHFVIGYKSDFSEDFLDLAPIPDTHELIQSYQITGLKAATTHFIRIYSENELGRSGFVYLNQTTADDFMNNESSVGPVVGGVAGSLLALTTVIVAAGLVYRRRNLRKGTQADTARNQESRPSTYQDLDLATISPPPIYSDLHTPGDSHTVNAGSSNYQNIDTTGPSHQYGNIQTAERSMAETQSVPMNSTYETLGPMSEASVYDDLAQKTGHTESTYVNTAIQRH